MIFQKQYNIVNKILIALQLSAILRNKTGIEDWIVEKAQYRRYGTNEVFVHPYSKGWLFNAKQVLRWNCRPVGDGIVWPVIEGCDQYTLTVSFDVSDIRFDSKKISLF